MPNGFSRPKARLWPEPAYGRAISRRLRQLTALFPKNPPGGARLTAPPFAGKALLKPDGGNTANPVRSERKQRQQTLPGVRPTKNATKSTLSRFLRSLENFAFKLPCPLREQPLATKARHFFVLLSAEAGVFKR